MMEKKKVYHCKHCGNLVESLWNGKVDVVCCGEPMQALSPNSVDAAHEKHVPVVTRSGDQVTVKVGATPHPMTPDHYILFVELLQGQKVYRHDFVEGDQGAEVTFCIPDDGTALVARAYCNLHGFWTSQS